MPITKSMEAILRYYWTMVILGVRITKKKFYRLMSGYSKLTMRSENRPCAKLCQTSWRWRTFSINVRMWVLMTGNDAAYGQEEEMWFRVRASFVCRKLGIGSYRQLHEHMRRYLYSWTDAEAELGGRGAASVVGGGGV